MVLVRGGCTEPHERSAEKRSNTRHEPDTETWYHWPGWEFTLHRCLMAGELYGEMETGKPKSMAAIVEGQWFQRWFVALQFGQEMRNVVNFRVTDHSLANSY
ncbi:unnamed protein product [Arctogadus glacialis]